jgi:hypothetical protein
MKYYFCSLIPFLHYFATANSEDSTQLNSSAPKLISRQAGVPKLYSSLHSMLLNTSLQPLCTDHGENPASVIKEEFTDPLPSNGRPTVARVDSGGNVFTESLPSNGSIRHNTNNIRFVGRFIFSGPCRINVNQATSSSQNFSLLIDVF